MNYNDNIFATPGYYEKWIKDLVKLYNQIKNKPTVWPFTEEFMQNETRFREHLRSFRIPRKLPPDQIP